jgi:hypothetical protein
MSETAHRCYMAWYMEQHVIELTKHDTHATWLYSKQLPPFHMILRPRLKRGSGTWGHTSSHRSDHAQIDSIKNSVEPENSESDDIQAFHISLRSIAKPRHGGRTRGHTPASRDGASCHR